MGELKRPPSVPGGRRNHLSIRLADKPTDVKAIINLGQQAHEESLYRDMPLDREKLSRLGERALSRPDSHALLMAEKDGELIGFLAAMADEHFFSKELAATCLIFFVAPQHRGGFAAIKLLHAFRRWAKAREIGYIYIHVTNGVAVKQTDKLLRRLGFRQTGGNYALNLGSK